MGYVRTAVGLLALLLTSATRPPSAPTALQRNATLAKLGTDICFERLARGKPDIGSTIILAGTNALDLCGCVGQLFATGLVGTPNPNMAPPDALSENPTSKAFDAFNTICMNRLKI